MFTENPCLVRHCRNNALSTFDENGNLTEEKSYCLDHIPDPGKLKQDIYNYIKNNNKIIGLCASGLIFQDIDFSNKEFYGCNFHRCTFTNIHSEKVLTHMCIFDFAVFNDCSFIKRVALVASAKLMRVEMIRRIEMITPASPSRLIFVLVEVFMGSSLIFH